jgi:hypothetical protein
MKTPYILTDTGENPLTLTLKTNFMKQQKTLLGCPFQGWVMEPPAPSRRGWWMFN